MKCLSRVELHQQLRQGRSPIFPQKGGGDVGSNRPFNKRVRDTKIMEVKGQGLALDRTEKTGQVRHTDDRLSFKSF